MIVSVRLFARARDLAGAPVVDLEVPEATTVAQLRRLLADVYPSLGPLLAHSALAVEDEFAGEEMVLRAGVEVALLPPVSGGESIPGERGL